MEALTQGVMLFKAGGPVMFLILLCSFGVVAIFIERWLYYRSVKSLPENFAEQFGNLLSNGDFAAATAYCRDSKSFAAAIALTGVPYLQESSAHLETVLESEAALKVGKLRENINHLESVVTVAPLLGLLGTVMGMVDSFQVMNIKSGEPMAITGGVGEALTATAFGLCVAIMAMAAYSYFSHRLNKVITDIEEVSALLIRRMK